MNTLAIPSRLLLGRRHTSDLVAMAGSVSGSEREILRPGSLAER